MRYGFMRSLAKARFAHVGKYWKKGRIQFLFNGFHAGSIILHIGKVKYKLIMRMGGDLFELELYHKIIKKNVWFFVTYEKPHLNIHCRNFIDYMSFQIQNLS